MDSEKMIAFKERSKRMQGFKYELREKSTPAEKAFKKVLRTHKIKCQFQRPFHSKDFKCIADFFFKSDKSNIVVEIDGDYHLTEDQIKKDSYRSKWLVEKRKCKIIRFSNHEVINNIDNCIKSLAKFYIDAVGSAENLSNNYLIFNTLKTNL